MKKLLLLFCGIALAAELAISVAMPAFALDPCECMNPTETQFLQNCEKDGKAMFCDGSEEGGSVLYIARIVLDIMLAGVIVAATIGIIICGYTVMTARDDQAHVEKAKKRIVEIVIGLIAFVVLWSVAPLVMPNANVNMAKVDVADLNKKEEHDHTKVPTNPGGTTPSKPGGGTNPGGGTQQPSQPSKPKERPRSCGPGTPGTPGSFVAIDSSLRKKYGQDTKVYTTSFGRTYYVYRQNDKNITWKEFIDTGCASTSYITVAHSFSNGKDYIPPRAGSSTMNEAIKSEGNIKKSDGGCSGSTADKIKCVITQKHGAVIIHQCYGSNCPNRGNHWFPIVDYKEEGGKAYYFLANTIAGTAYRFQQGWVPASFLNDRQLHIQSALYYIPATEVDCSV